MATTGIKNVIFDLGGVIINLSVEDTYKSFAALSGITLSEIKQRVHQSTFFREYEKGLITDAEFRHQVKSEFKLQVADEEIDNAWNAMLLDIPMERIKLLEQLRGSYRLFLLSNTNNIHLQCFNKQVLDLTGNTSLDVYFDNAYYSHLVKMAKPDVEIYEHVLVANNLQPSETLFLDDNLDNLAGANKAGIKTFHVQNPNQIFSLF